jgi:hypothetical protein
MTFSVRRTRWVELDRVTGDRATELAVLGALSDDLREDSFGGYFCRLDRLTPRRGERR